MITQLDITTAVLVLAFAMFLRYVFFSGIAYSLVWKKFKSKFTNRRLLYAPFKETQIKKEVLNSFWTTVVYGIVLGSLLNKHIVGKTKVYFDVSDYGWGYFFLSLILIFFLHDFYFYVTHRLLHTPFLFRTVHIRHHSSQSPDPWTSYSFHPGEALTLVLFMPIIVFSFPVNFWVLNIFGLGSFVFNVLGHLGYEIMPKNFIKSGAHYFWNTATHHSLHHKYPNSNYSLYFNYWDRVFGTNHSTYQKELAAVLKKDVL